MLPSIASSASDLQGSARSTAQLSLPNHFQQDLHNSLGGVTVPEGGDGSFLPLSSKEQIQCWLHGRRIGSYEFVGTHGASLWSFGIVT